MHLAVSNCMVGNDDLVHALKVIHAHQFQGRHLQLGFFRDFTGDSFFRGFTGFHEARDQRKTSAWPSGISCEQNLVAVLNNAGEHWRWVVPVRPLTHHTAHPLFGAAIFFLGDGLQLGGAHRAKLKMAHAGNTPVDR